MVCIPLLLGGCVTPYMGSDVAFLSVKPKQNLYPLDYVFVPANELAVTVISSTGETRQVPVNSTTVDFNDNFSMAGEKTGRVKYFGKEGEFTIFVYDPANPGAIPPGGPTLEIIIQ